MRKNQLCTLIIGIILTGVLFTSCKKNQHKPECDGSNLTYNSGISAIINSSCLGSSCHGNGAANANFSTYTQLQPYLSNGKFRAQVLEKKTMPKNASLSNEQLNKIQCWVDNNYPEN